MSKRISIRYKGGSHYIGMKLIPAGTIFKAVDAEVKGGKLTGVYIRGSSLTKATKGKYTLKGKQYLFIVSGGAIDNQMEVICDSQHNISE